jgi:hypothetical protein
VLSWVTGTIAFLYAVPAVFMVIQMRISDDRTYLLAGAVSFGAVMALWLILAVNALLRALGRVTAGGGARGDGWPRGHWPGREG